MSGINTTTQDTLLPKVLDTILGKGSSMASRLIGSAKKWDKEGDMYKSIKVTKNDTGDYFDAGDLLDTSAVDTRIKLTFSTKFRYKTVALFGTELTKNKNGVISLMNAEMESAARDLADDIGDDFYSDLGTGKSMNGMANIVDDGTNAATYGGQSRSTYTTLKANVTASGGTLTLAKMSTMYNAPDEEPNIGVANRAVISLYEQLLTPYENTVKVIDNYKGGIKGRAGLKALEYKGMPIIPDVKATSGNLYFLNEEYLDFYANPMYGEKPFKFKTVTEGADYGQPMGLGFTWDGDWKNPVNQKSMVSQITFAGNFICWNPKAQSVLTGITSV